MSGQLYSCLYELRGSVLTAPLNRADQGKKESLTDRHQRARGTLLLGPGALEHGKEAMEARVPEPGDRAFTEQGRNLLTTS